MRGVAEIKSLGRMPWLKSDGIGACGDSHSLQRFVGLETSGLTREHGCHILFQRHSRDHVQTPLARSDGEGEGDLERGEALSLQASLAEPLRLRPEVSASPKTIAFGGHDNGAARAPGFGVCTPEPQRRRWA